MRFLRSSSSRTSSANDSFSGPSPHGSGGSTWRRATSDLSAVGNPTDDPEGPKSRTRDEKRGRGVLGTFAPPLQPPVRVDANSAPCRFFQIGAPLPKAPTGGAEWASLCLLAAKRKLLRRKCRTSIGVRDEAD